MRKHAMVKESQKEYIYCGHYGPKSSFTHFEKHGDKVVVVDD
jgi:adenine/guanine phosphoribosyltransferase-like PRPP-binding protein